MIHTENEVDRFLDRRVDVRLVILFIVCQQFVIDWDRIDIFFRGEPLNRQKILSYYVKHLKDGLIFTFFIQSCFAITDNSIFYVLTIALWVFFLSGGSSFIDYFTQFELNCLKNIIFQFFVMDLLAPNVLYFIATSFS